MTDEVTKIGIGTTVASGIETLNTKIIHSALDKRLDM